MHAGSLRGREGGLGRDDDYPRWGGPSTTQSTATTFVLVAPASIMGSELPSRLGSGPSLCPTPMPQGQPALTFTERGTVCCVPRSPLHTLIVPLLGSCLSTWLLASGCALRTLQRTLTTFKDKNVRVGGQSSPVGASPPPFRPDLWINRVGAPITPTVRGSGPFVFSNGIPIDIKSARALVVRT